MSNKGQMLKEIEPYVREWFDRWTSESSSTNAAAPNNIYELPMLSVGTPTLYGLSSARRLQVSAGVKQSDAGAGADLTLSFDEAANIAITGTHSWNSNKVKLTSSGIELYGEQLSLFDSTAIYDIGHISGSAPGSFSSFTAFQVVSTHASQYRALELIAHGNTSGSGVSTAVIVESGSSESSQRVQALIGGVARLEVRDAGTYLTQAARSSGSPVAFTLTPGAHVTLAASTEAADVDLALNRTVAFSTGALATQRAFIVRAPTYAFAGASTLTTAATLAITGAPAAGINATITNSYALHVESGKTRVGGSLQVTSSALSLPTGSTDIIQIAAQTAPSGTPSGSAVIYCDGVTKLITIKDTAGQTVSVKPNEMGEIYLENNATATTISAGSTFYKVAGTTTLGHNHEFDMPTDNRLRYLGATMRSAHIGCTLSVSSGSANQVIQCKIYKNGSALTGSLIETKLGAGGDVTSTAIHIMTHLSTNDYLELYVANITAANNVTIKHMNLFAAMMSHGMD